MDCLGARSSTCNNSLNFCIVWNLQTKKQILGNTLNSQHPHHKDGIQSSELVWNLVRCHMRHSPKRAMQNKSPWRYSPISVNPNDNFNDSFISKKHKEWLKKTPKWLIPLAESPAQIYHCNADIWSGYPGKQAGTCEWLCTASVWVTASWIRKSSEGWDHCCLWDLP